jgi:hypothetical protein
MSDSLTQLTQLAELAKSILLIVVILFLTTVVVVVAIRMSTQKDKFRRLCIFIIDLAIAITTLFGMFLNIVVTSGAIENNNYLPAVFFGICSIVFFLIFISITGTWIKKI